MTITGVCIWFNNWSKMLITSSIHCVLYISMCRPAFKMNSWYNIFFDITFFFLWSQIKRYIESLLYFNSVFCYTSPCNCFYSTYILYISLYPQSGRFLHGAPVPARFSVWRHPPCSDFHLHLRAHRQVRHVRWPGSLRQEEAGGACACGQSGGEFCGEDER